MICSFCNGNVIWRGPLLNLTHTECEDCGRHNCQMIDPPPPEDLRDESSDGGDDYTFNEQG